MKKFDLEKILYLYAVTDESINIVAKAEEAMLAGITCLQYRVTGKPDYEKALELRNLCRRYSIPFIVNNDVELARLIQADGVHIGQSDMPAKEARAILGSDAIIGVSAGTLREALQAERDGADYLGVGAMFPTTSKSDAVSVSKSTLRSICTSITIPVVAIGGIAQSNVMGLSHSGIVGIAVISAIFSPHDSVSSATKQLLHTLKTVDYSTPDFGLYLVDFDGTMIDSMSIWATLAIDFLMSYGKFPRPDLGEKLTNWGLRDGIIYLRDAYNLPCSAEECLTRFTDLLISRYKSCNLKPGVRELAEFVAMHDNILLRCATASSAVAVTKVLLESKLLDYYQPVVSTGDIGIDKSNPEFYFRMLENNGASLQASCVFDDAPFALQAAHEAGMKTVRIRDPFWANIADDAIPVDCSVDSLAEYLKGTSINTFLIEIQIVSV